MKQTLLSATACVLFSVSAMAGGHHAPETAAPTPTLSGQQSQLQGQAQQQAQRQGQRQTANASSRSEGGKGGRGGSGGNTGPITVSNTNAVAVDTAPAATRRMSSWDPCPVATRAASVRGLGAAAQAPGASCRSCGKATAAKRAKAPGCSTTWATRTRPSSVFAKTLATARRSPTLANRARRMWRAGRRRDTGSAATDTGCANPTTRDRTAMGLPGCGGEDGKRVRLGRGSSSIRAMGSRIDYVQ